VNDGEIDVIGTVAWVGACWFDKDEEEWSPGCDWRCIIKLFLESNEGLSSVIR
jgi:hypothetical protein